MKKENETRMQKMEEMHKEKMQRFDRLLNLYERDLPAGLQVLGISADIRIIFPFRKHVLQQ